eukprot:m.191192 g.191192  ORF g.191192 m.191192 type:complete len:424 (+) comp18585_c0_seq1:178-1449(+)
MSDFDKGVDITCSWAILDSQAVQEWPSEVPKIDITNSLPVDLSDVVHLTDAKGKKGEGLHDAIATDRISIIYKGDSGDDSPLEIGFSFGQRRAQVARVTLVSSAQTVEWLANGEYVKTSKGSVSGAQIVPCDGEGSQVAPSAIFSNSCTDLRMASAYTMRLLRLGAHPKSCFVRSIDVVVTDLSEPHLLPHQVDMARVRERLGEKNLHGLSPGALSLMQNIEASHSAGLGDASAGNGMSLMMGSLGALLGSGGAGRSGPQRATRATCPSGTVSDQHGTAGMLQAMVSMGLQGFSRPENARHGQNMPTRTQTTAVGTSGATPGSTPHGHTVHANAPGPQHSEAPNMNEDAGSRSPEEIADIPTPPPSIGSTAIADTMLLATVARVEKRMNALEGKLDRVLELLEGHICKPESEGHKHRGNFVDP